MMIARPFDRVRRSRNRSSTVPGLIRAVHDSGGLIDCVTDDCLPVARTLHLAGLGGGESAERGFDAEEAVELRGHCADVAVLRVAAVRRIHQAESR